MLWMKGWLETRWRLVFVLGWSLAVLAFGREGGGLASAKDAQRLIGMLSFLLIFATVYLAGAGIRTQSGFRAMKGLHGSMYYTLSLPVSRLRLLAVRVGCGLLETAGIDAIVVGAAWSLFPAVRAHSTFLSLLLLILAAIACTACFFFVSVLLATWLGEQWQFFGSLFVVGVLQQATARLHLPPSFDVFRFGGDASPLITHTLPWPAMAVSLSVSAVLFFAALRIVQTSEY